jgi:hypothetical protein
MLFGFVFGITVAIFLVVIFIVFAERYSQRFSNLDETQLRDLIFKLLIHGENYETLNFSGTNGDVFAQFKKYINSADDFGVDFVLPLVGRYAGKKPLVLETCSKNKLYCKFVETVGGWSFAFIQVNDGASICDRAIAAVIELSELDFSKNVGVSVNSTFRWRRKDKVLGNQTLSKDEPSRYDIEPDTRD